MMNGSIEVSQYTHKEEFHEVLLWFNIFNCYVAAAGIDSVGDGRGQVAGCDR